MPTRIRGKQVWTKVPKAQSPTRRGTGECRRRAGPGPGQSLWMAGPRPSQRLSQWKEAAALSPEPPLPLPSSQFHALLLPTHSAPPIPLFAFSPVLLLCGSSSQPRALCLCLCLGVVPDAACSLELLPGALQNLQAQTPSLATPGSVPGVQVGVRSPGWRNGLRLGLPSGPLGSAGTSFGKVALGLKSPWVFICTSPMLIFFFQ